MNKILIFIFIIISIYSKFLSDEEKYVIGLHLEGTKTIFGIVDKKGKIIETGKIRTKGFNSATSYIDACIEALKPLIEKVGGMKKIVGMGIGAPNANYYAGTIEFCPNLQWAHNGIIPIGRMFSERLNDIPVGVTNDANAAAVGEKIYGVAQNMKDFIFITLGTGVGSGIFIDNKLVLGSDGFAGELGHVKMVKENGRSCGCGGKGCLEAYASATGLVRTAVEYLQKSSEPSILRDIDLKELTSLDVAKAAEKGDSLSKKIFEETGRMLGQACANFAAFSSPEAFIFFGELADSGELILNPIKKAYDESVMPVFKGKPKFLISGLDGSNAAILGASAIGWEAVEEHEE